MIVVLGAGLAGLSAALHLQDHEEVLVLEKEDRPGGLCRSFVKDGFTFDLTGHLLHLRRPEIRSLVESLIPQDRFARIDRRAFIHSRGVFTPYPFQVNTHGLPPEVVKECLMGFVEALGAGEVGSGEVALLSFKQWVLRTFGAGIARHFMIPYNEKLWLTDLDEVTCDWVSWSIPRPTLSDVVDGALGISRKSFGYNPSFLYPKSGGIQILPEALAARVRGITCRAEVASVDAARRAVTLRSGGEIPYDHLVSTMPLPKLLAVTRGLPRGVADAARGLRHVAVINLNLGVERVLQRDKHWVYFPEKEYPFYRAGFPASFTEAAAPEGCSSIYLEIALRPGEPWDADLLFEQARQGLIRAGVLSAQDRIVCRQAFHIDPAYVIYDKRRREIVPRALEELAARGIHSIGRYGAWYYNSMEESMADGRALALEILAGKASPAGASAKAD
jgi:protoporphyrinogen oxidase